MIDFGTVQPGTTLYIPFNTFDSNDPSASVTLTGLATTDIEIYKDGSVTQRASDAGYALLDTDGIDFDAITGIHGISVDLADNTTAGFYAAGSQYWVVISSVTVDAATINFVAATFRIGYQGARLNTTIATLASQTSFTLTAGPAEDDALNGQWCVIHDVASAVQCGHAIISDYTGATKTVTLAAGTTFTAVAGDNISIMGPSPVQPTVAGRTLDVSAGGEAGIDWANVGTPGSTVSLSATTVATVTTAATATNLTNLPSIPANWVTTAGITDGAFTAAKFAASSLNGKGDWNVGKTGYTLTATTGLGNQTANITGNLSGSVGSVTGHTPQTGDSFARIGALGAGLTAVPWNASWDAEVQSEVQDAIEANHLDHLLAADYDPAAKPGVATALLNEIVESDAGVSRFTVNALENAPSGTGASASAIADEVQTRTIAAVTVVNGLAANTVTAAALATDAVTEIQSGLATAAALATVDGIVDAILVDTGTDGVVVATASKTGYALTATTGLGNQTANITGNLSGSVGSVTGAVGSVTGAVGSVTAGVTVTTNNDKTGYALTATTGLGNQTANITGNLSGSVGSVTGLTAANLDAAISTRATPAQVNTEVVDALNTDTYAEPGQGAPAATASLVAKLGYLYKAWRNKSAQTASQYSLYNDDAATVDQRATFSDDATTATRGEIATGP